MKKLLLFVSLLFLCAFVTQSFAQSHLLVTEFVVSPTEGEFVEIYNGTGATVELTNYYLTDDCLNGNNDYINLVDGSATISTSDFIAKFPDGAMIEDGQYLTIATDGAGFNTTYGKDADFELRGTSATTTDMVSPFTGAIGSSAGLTNAGEVIVLLNWDGASDLVKDVDIALWGDKEEAVDKTGVTKDGPDADTIASAYLNDTPAVDQKVVNSGLPHAIGKSVARTSLMEIDEISSGGNGITGHDETSEDVATAFAEADPTPGAAYVGFVNVTFICNTAAWRDTVSGDYSLVQLRGTTITAAGQSSDDASVDTLSPGTIINWGALSSMYLREVSGDYWMGTFRMPAGTKMAYKFFVNANHDTVAPGDEWEHAGWESNVVEPPGIYSNNRGLDLTGFMGTDTILPVQFANGWKGQIQQYETPYTTEEGSFVLWARVNMMGWEDFDPENQTIGVRGSNMVDWGETGNISWGKTLELTREGTSGMAGNFYSGAIRVPDSYATAGVQFKVVVHHKGNPLDEDWGNMIYNPNTQYNITTVGNDTTIQYKWFDNLRPRAVEHPDQIIVNYMVDLKDAVANRGFTLGDTLQVRMGYEQSAAQRYDKYLKRQGAGTIYTGKDTIQAMIGRDLFYQYYSVIKGTEYREVYFNFDYPDPSVTAAEKRQIIPEAAELNISDVGESLVDPRRMPLFRSVEVIAQDSILVTLECDARPAIYQLLEGDTLSDIQGQLVVTNPDTVLAWGVAVNGPLTGGWSSTGGDWGRHLMDIANKAMHDDGTHGDAVAGDSIFTIQFTIYKDSTTQVNGPSNIIGQEFKFGIGGGDNESGYGNNHIVNVDDSQNHYTIQAQFGSIAPKKYWAWDFDNHRPMGASSVNNIANLPTQYRLEQNYPNPFNPSTHIKYSLKESGLVTLKIYNVVGQHVRTLVNQPLTAGFHTAVWDGKDLHGSTVSSGIYFYEIKAGEFAKVRKMMLLR
ncbi:lamin tail domain-containing protein [candidate division KSB1 bacterium]|nr:lamin tail domain-containing protein [candidate division KSB1 bacterium]